MTESLDIVWPCAQRVSICRPAEKHLETLSGRRIGLMWNHLFRGDEVFETLTQVLNEFGAVVVDWRRFGDFHNQGGEKVLASLADTLRKEEVDAVIAGVGA